MIDLRLRQAVPGDCAVCFEWANDPFTRSNSFHSDPIPESEHVRWFAARLEDPDTAIFIGETANQEPVGQVRFERKPEETVVSISIASAFRGQGLGKALLMQATREYVSSHPGETIHAYIKSGNGVSRAIFRAAGYAPSGQALIRGTAAELYSYAGKPR